jgi:uncharacterized protein (TIGR02996 family)
MNVQAALLQALHESSGDSLAWQALADWLEESGQPDRAALLRLDLALRALPAASSRTQLERRLRPAHQPRGPAHAQRLGPT